MVVAQTPTVAGVQAELASLVASLRPGIMASMGCAVTTGDRLTELGLTGWRLGIGSLTHASDALDIVVRETDTVVELRSWLGREADKERYRWNNAVTTMRALDRAVSTTPPGETSRAFIDTWESNLCYTETRLEMGICGISGPVAELTERISGRLIDATDGRRVLVPLRRMAMRASAPLDHPWHHAGIVADEDLAMLKSWLKIG